MGDMADMVYEGIVCQECGVFITDNDWPDAAKNSCGYPRFCRACGGDPECNGAIRRKRNRRKKRRKTE